jgi:putative phosphoesterase
VHRIGVISDTHGLLRPEALAVLRGCLHIVHAGDIGGDSVLEDLGTLAPVTAVRGNNDRGAWAERLPASQDIRVADVSIHVVHDLADLPRTHEPVRARVVVSGHSHRPSITQQGETLFLNPGSAGPRRFSLPVSLAELLVDDQGNLAARLHELSVASQRRRRP